jgi:hypothetical protein
MKERVNKQQKVGSCMLTRPRNAEGNCLHSQHHGNLQCLSFVVTCGQPHNLLVSC